MAKKNASRQWLVMIFPSNRPPRTTQICVFLADLSDPRAGITDADLSDVLELEEEEED